MTEKEKKLLESAKDMTYEEANDLYDKYKEVSSDEFKSELVHLLAEKVFTDEWWENEIDFEDALMELDPKYRESLINEDWRELLDT